MISENKKKIAIKIITENSSERIKKAKHLHKCKKASCNIFVHQLGTHSSQGAYRMIKSVSRIAQRFQRFYRQVHIYRFIKIYLSGNTFSYKLQTLWKL